VNCLTSRSSNPRRRRRAGSSANSGLAPIGGKPYLEYVAEIWEKDEHDMNIFDRKVGDPFPPEGRCAGCDRPLDECPADPASAKAFVGLTGRGWPGSVSLNLRKDFRTLNLDANRVPARGDFCLACSVSYMREFNRRLSALTRDDAACG
jgi:hypothetical protein